MVSHNTRLQGDKFEFLRHGGICLFGRWKVLVSRFAKLGRNAVLATVVLALAFPASSAFAEDPAPVAPSEPVVVDGDAVIPEGDEGNNPSADAPVSSQVRIAVETAHAFGSPESSDRIGYETSLYQGKWYMPNREKLRKCISRVESRHHYKTGRGGPYRGAYQFSKSLARGVTWMMQPEVKKEMGDAGVDLVKQLRKTPMNEWNRYWQDRAFWTVWDKGQGKNHWRGGSGRCF